MAMAAAALTLWVTFVPCFLWIFAFAPHVEWIATRRRLGGALAGVTAAVVGVIGNLAVWFALHVFFTRVETIAAGPLRLSLPDATSLDPVALAIAVAAGWALLWRHWGLLPVLAGSALAGLAFGTLG